MPRFELSLRVDVGEGCIVGHRDFADGVFVFADEVFRTGVAFYFAHGVEPVAAPEDGVAALAGDGRDTDGAAFFGVEGGDQFFEMGTTDVRHVAEADEGAVGILR